MNLRFVIAIFFLISTLSCTYSPSTGIISNKNQLSKYNAVALNVSSSELDVKYSKETGPDSLLLTGPLTVFGILGPLSLFVGGGIESAIESSKDRARAEAVREGLDKYYFEKLLGDYFIKHIRNANSFKISYDEHQHYKALIDKGYNAIIELNIEDLYLKRAGSTNMLNFYVSVSGKFVDLQNEEVIWGQQEVVTSDEEYTLDEYKAEGAKKLRDLIDKAFNKVAFRMACNIIYSK